MMRVERAALVLVLCLVGVAAAQQPPADELRKLEGGWIVVAAERGKPKHLDFLHDKDGVVWEAIYTVTDDTFRLNYVEAGEGNRRPTLFATSADTAGTVIVMNRMTKR